MKKSVLFFTVALICVSAYTLAENSENVLADGGYSGSCGENVTYDFDETNGALTISGSGPMYDYPGSKDTPWYLFKDNITTVTINGSVSTVGNYAFAECENLKKVMISSTVSIGDYAFALCTSLDSVYITASVTAVGSYSFYSCAKLESLDLGNSAKTIKGYAFFECTNLQTLDLGNSVETIGEKAFYGCSALGTVTVPESVKSVGASAFEDCTSLGSVEILGSIGTLESSLFSGCNSLGSVTIPNSVKSIGSSAFYNCTNLRTLDLGNSVETIGEKAFYGCSALGTVTVPESVKSVGASAFEDCTSLGSVEILGSISTLESSLFSGCIGLGSFTVPESVTTIGDSVFFECTNLRTLDLGNSVGTIGEKAFYGCSALGTVTIPESVTTLESSLFSGCIRLGSVTLPQSLTTIKNNVFYDCTSLGSFIVSDSVTSIGSYAFEGCTSLTKLTLPISFNSVGTDSTPIFYSCTNISEITFTAGTGEWYDYGSSYISAPWQRTSADLKVILSEGVSSVADNIFCECTALTSVELGKSVAVIEEYAFDGCKSLTALNVTKDNTEYSSTDGVLFNKNGNELIMYPAGKTDKLYEVPKAVEIIGPHAFKDCIGLRNISLGDAVRSIEYDAFEGCTSFRSFEVSEGNTTYSSDNGVLFSHDKKTLIKFPAGKQATSYIIPDTVTSIDSYAFANCIYLESVTLQNGVASIGDHAFYSSAELKEANILGSALRTIGESAFCNCSKLGSIVIPNTIEKVGDSAFEGCTGLAELTIPISLNGVGSNDRPIFRGCIGIESITFTAGSGTWYPYGSDEAQESCYKYAPWQITEADFAVDLSGVSVNTIPGLTFYNCDTLCSITLNDSIESIGDCAFRGCSSLKTISFPNTLRSIGIYAFEGCADLGSVVFPDNLETIAERAFENCSSLGSVMIPANIVSIGTRAFSNCTILTAITVNENNINYASYDGVLFNKDRTTLIQYPAGKSDTQYVIPESVTSIGVSAFYDCTGLTELTIPGNVGSIGVSAFYGCTGLTELTIPADLDSVVLNEYPAFEGCVNIEKVVFTGSGQWFAYSDSESGYSYYGYTPWQISRSVLKTVSISDGVTTVEKFAFSGCNALESVTISDSVKSVGLSAFKDCSSLKTISLPSSLNTVVSNEHYVFEGCINIAEITFTRGYGYWYDYEKTYEDSDEYYELTPWNITQVDLAIIISDGIEYIESSVFSECDTFTELTIGNSVKWIGGYAFNSCDKLKSVVIPDSVESIGTNSFASCDNLEYVSISNSITVIPSGAFYYCTALSEIKFGTSVKTIEFMAFYKCAVTTLNLDTVEAIGDSAFYGCKSLEVTFGDSLRSIAKSAFGWCTELSNIDFGNSVTTIGNLAFYFCYGLHSLTIPASVESIGEYAFCNCSNITDLVINCPNATLGKQAFGNMEFLRTLTVPISLNTVGPTIGYAFQGSNRINHIKFTAGSGTWYQYSSTSETPWMKTYSSLTITLCEGVTYVPQEGFRECSKLIWLNISNTVISLGDYAFYMCSGLRSVTIPSALSSIGSFAFCSCKSLQSIDVDSENTVYGSIDGVLFNKNYSTLIQYPAGRSTESGSYEIPDAVESIGAFAFKNCSNITSVIIPDSVTSAGYYAFQSCTDLRELVIPLSLDSVGYNDRPIFDNCPNINTIIFTAGSGTWYEYGTSSTEASYYGYAPWHLTLQSPTLVLANGVAYVCDWIFNNTSITSVKIGNSLATIEPFAFEGCTKLTSFYVSEDNPNFSSDENGVLLNKDQTSLVLYPLGKTETTYEISDSVKSVEKYAFYECTALTTIVIPSSVTSLGISAFYGCINLTDLTIPAGLDSVASNEHPAFQGCIGIETITVTGPGTWYPYGTSKSDDSYYRNTPWQLSRFTLKNVTISEGVPYVGQFAFMNCAELKSLVFGSSVKYIEESAFDNCTGLESFSLPSSIENIGVSAFSECLSLKSVTFPASLISISDSAFYRCIHLESLTFEDKIKLESIGMNAFKQCESLRSVEIPDSVRSIETNAFYQCTSLVSLNLGSSVEEIGTSAFADCRSITSLTIPKSVKSLGSSAFYGCSGLTELSLPACLDSVVSNSNPVFKGCVNIGKITFTGSGDSWYPYGTTKSEPSYYGYTPWQLTTADLTAVVDTGVISVDSLAFYECPSLTAVSISKSVETIGDKAFGSCTKLISFEVDEENPVYSSDDDGVLFYKDSKLVQYPAGKEETSYVIPDNVSSIGSSAFSGCSNLTEITLGSSIEEIENESFIHCYLTSINVSEENSRYTSDDGVLFNKDKSTLILYPAHKEGDAYSIPDGTRTVKSYAFSGCTNLTNMIIISKTVSSIEDLAFEGCTNKSFFVYPGNLYYGSVNGALCDKNKTLIQYPLGNTDTTYVIDDSGLITAIGDYAFYGCTWLNEMTIPSSVTSIGDYAFYGCTGLTSLTISSPETVLGKSAFKNCENLEILSIPVSVNSVGSNEYPAFEGCSKFTQITFTGSGDWFVYGDETQESSYLYTPWYLSQSALNIILSDDVTGIASYAFHDCTNLETIKIGKSVGSIERTAFEGCKSLKEFIVDPDNPTYSSENGVLFKDNNSVLVLYPRSKTDNTYSLQDSVRIIEDYAFSRCSRLVTVDLNSVTSIGNYAFYSCTNLENLTVGSSLGSIGNNAFYNCISLSSMDFNDSLKSIGQYAFFKCIKLDVVAIPASVTDIGISAFENCTGLTELTVPISLDTVVSGEDPVFGGCVEIKKITFTAGDGNWYQYGADKSRYTPWQLTEAALGVVISDDITSVGDYVFRHCTSLLSVTLPGKATSIGASAFEGCTSLASLEIPASVTKLGYSAFKDCTGLKELTVPVSLDTVVSNEDPVFGGCAKIYKITFTGSGEWYLYGTDDSQGSCYKYTPWQITNAELTVVLSDTVDSVGSRAFYNCTKLADIDLGTRITSIGASAFEGCTSLVSLTIPVSVEELGGSSFKGCTGMIELAAPAGLNCVGSNEYPAFSGCVNIEKATFVGSGGWYPYGPSYSFTPWYLSKSALTTVCVSDEVKSIGDYAFYNCTALKSVTLGSSVTELGESAFKNCRSLLSIVVGNSVKSIGEGAFYNCTSLGSAVLGNEVGSIGDYAFYNCIGLESVTLGGSVEKIGTFAFANCIFLGSIDIPESVKTLGSCAFANCNSLESVIIPDAVTAIGGGAFEGCTGLKELSIPVSLDSVGSNVSPIFRGCYSIEKITFTAGTGEWYDYSSSESTGSYYGYTPWQLSKSVLNEVEISDGVKSVGDSAFFNYTALQSVSLPESVTRIGVNSFNGCTSLESIDLGGTIGSIGAFAFYGCTKLAYIDLGTQPLSIGASAFEGCTSLASLVIPESVTDLGYSAFKNCIGLKELTVPVSLDTVVSNEDPVFGGCAKINKITFTGSGEWYRYGSDDSQESCYKYTPWQITNTKLTVVLSDTVDSVGSRAFYNCTNLNDIDLGTCITSIGTSAFEGCTALDSLVIPGKVETIESSAFEGCINLTSVGLGASVGSIGNRAFFNCTKLAEFTVDAENTCYSADKGVLFKDGSILVLYPVGKTDSSYDIPAYVRSIGNYAFANCALASMTIPDTVEKIGEGAFKDCKNLTVLSIPVSLDSVGSNSSPIFSGCTGIEKIIFTAGNGEWYPYGADESQASYYGYTPWQMTNAYLAIVISDDVVSVGERAFYDCASITEVLLGASVGSIGDLAFFNCARLSGFTVSEENTSYTSIDGVLFKDTKTVLVLYPLGKTGSSYEIPDSVTSIGNYAFANCAFTSMSIPDTVEKIGKGAFKDCKNLKILSIPVSLDSVGSNTSPIFSGCTDIEKMIFTAGKTGDWYGYKSSESEGSYYGYTPWQLSKSVLNEIEISDGVKSVGDRAFEGCIKLNAVSLPDSVTSLGISSFNGCTTLAEVTLGTEIASVGDSAFEGCTALTSVTISGSATKLGSSVFKDCAKLKELTIPISLDTVVSNEHPAFGGCVSIDKITFTAGSGNWYPYGTDESQASYYRYTPWQITEAALKVAISDDVTSVGAYAFKDCSKLTEVSLGELVASIGDHAFDNCTSLGSVTIPSQVTSIGESAFEGCTSLGSILIPDRVTSIGASAFEGCSVLASVKLGASVGSIGDHAFFDCTKLAELSVSEDNTRYSSKDNVLFKDNGTTLVLYPIGRSGNSYTVPDSVRSIDASAFAYCTSLTSVKIPVSVGTIGESAFLGCTGLTELTIPAILDSVVSNEHPAFEGCANINKITFTGTGDWFKYGTSASEGSYYGYTPWQLSRSVLKDIAVYDGVTSIGDLAFDNCILIGSLVIPKSVTSLGKSAFSGCTDLKELTVPASLDTVVSNEHPAFGGCVNIDTVTFTGNGNWYPYGTDESQASYYRYTPWQITEAALKVTISDDVISVGAYAFKDCFKLTEASLGELIASIGDHAFDNCTSLGSVTIPSKVTSIGESAFEGCTSLGSLTVPVSVKSAGNWAFKDCTGLKNLSVPVTLDCAGANDRPVFSGCTNIENITFTGSGEWYSYESSYAYTPWYLSRENLVTATISDGITSIGFSAFNGCVKLTSVTVPDSVTAIGGEAFYNCVALESISLGPVTKLESDVFYNCVALQSLALDSVSSMGDCVFYNCTALRYVSLGDSITSIGDYTFYNCTALGSLILPKSVETIGALAFANCTALGSIAIPSSVSEIGNSAFANCTALSAANIPDAIESIGKGAFYGCSGLKDLTIPASADAVGSEASPIFSGCTNIEKITFTAGTIGAWYDYEKSHSDYTPWQLSRSVLKNIVISDGVKSVGNYAFYNDVALVSVSLPGSVTKIGDCTFCGCTSLVSIDLGDSLESIGFSAFYNCASLSSLKLCKSLQSIGTSAFEGCTSLASLTIPESVTELGDSSFKDCTGLKELTVPISLDTVGSSTDPAFEGCVSIEKITFTVGNGDWHSYDADKFRSTPWKLTEAALAVIMSDGITSVGNGAFDHCTSLSSVSIPSTVASIGASAFEGCTSLASLTIPDSVSDLGTSAFKDCAGLKELTVPASLDCVGSNQSPIFSGCVNIEKVSFTAGTGDWCPYDSPAVVDNGHTNDASNGTELPYYGSTPWQLSRSVLNTVIVYEGVRSVGAYAFYDCTGLASVSLPSTVATIGNFAFRGCTSLASIDISGDNANYSQVDGVLFDKGITTLIGYPAGNTDSSYVIPGTVTTIGSYAFYDCAHLTAITIPGSVTSIGDSAFKGVFYDADGETALEPTASNLAGSTFEKTGDRWVKQISHNEDGSGGNSLAYILVAVVAAIIVSVVAVVVLKKRKV